MLTLSINQNSQTPSKKKKKKLTDSCDCTNNLFYFNLIYNLKRKKKLI